MSQSGMSFIFCFFSIRKEEYPIPQSLKSNLFGDVRADFVDIYAYLLHSIAVADSDLTVVEQIGRAHV